MGRNWLWKWRISKFQKCISQPFVVGFYWNLARKCNEIRSLGCHDNILKIGSRDVKGSQKQIFQKLKKCISQPFIIGSNSNWKYSSIILAPYSWYVDVGHMTSRMPQKRHLKFQKCISQPFMLWFPSNCNIDAWWYDSLVDRLFSGHVTSTIDI